MSLRPWATGKGRLKLAPDTIYPITPAEVVAANTGKRDDFLVHTYKVYQLTTDPDVFYQSNGSQLVLVSDQAEKMLVESNVSPVFMVNTTRTLVDALGAPVSTGGGSTYPEVTNFAALPGTAAVGTTYVVLTATGVPFVNRKDSGLYR